MRSVRWRDVLWRKLKQPRWLSWLGSVVPGRQSSRDLKQTGGMFRSGHQGATGAGPRQEVAGPESGGPGRLTGEAKPQEVLCSPGVAVAPTLLSPGEALGPQPGLAHGRPAGLAYICEGLKEQKKGLETLVLWNNQLTHTGMAFLGMTLVSRAGRGAGAAAPPVPLGAALCPRPAHAAPQGPFAGVLPVPAALAQLPEPRHPKESSLPHVVLVFLHPARKSSTVFHIR